MRKIFTAIAFAAALFAVQGANAQVKLGLKGGLNVTNMSFSEDLVSSSNRAGFFIGPSVKVSIPLAGLGVDAALLYDQRDSEVSDDDGYSYSLKQHSINIPINLRYNIGLGSLAAVYLAAGPQFGVNVGGKSIGLGTLGTYSMSDTNFSINVGAGVTLLSHVEVGFTYNIACGKTGDLSVWDAAQSVWSQSTRGRANAWQVSVAYYL